MTAASTPAEPSPPPPFEVRIARTREELDAIVAVRARVFRDEQRIVETELSDPDDYTSVHAYVTVGGRIVAAARLSPPNRQRAEGMIAWVATLPEYRRRGAATAATRALLAIADERGIPAVTLAAQVHAQALYERLGFVPYGDRFTVRGIPHQQMERRLPRRASA